jgi:hypothetical protein
LIDLIKLLLIDLKTSKRFEKKSDNGFVDCGLVNRSYEGIAKKGRKEGRKDRLI